MISGSTPSVWISVGAAKLEAHGQVGQWHGDERRDDDADSGDVERVEERLAHQPRREERCEVAESEAAIAVAEGGDENGADRDDQQQQQERGDRRQHQQRSPGGAEAAFAAARPRCCAVPPRHRA